MFRQKLSSTSTELRKEPKQKRIDAMMENLIILVNDKSLV